MCYACVSWHHQYGPHPIALQRRISFAPEVQEWTKTDHITGLEPISEEERVEKATRQCRGGGYRGGGKKGLQEEGNTVRLISNDIFTYNISEKRPPPVLARTRRSPVQELTRKWLQGT